ncbi:S8 family peptidase [Streptomyces sp. NPDC020141]|uniref:S8 family peptidase n=1 Tax=Streptomyces sp. NPDC020141 TaxID=3365065 RepID=UPI00379C8B48
MFNRHQRAGVAALTAAVSLALVAGMTGAGSATASPPPPGGSAAEAGPVSAGAEWVTLITGDRVRVDGRGRIVGFDPAKGRESVPVQTYTDRGHTYAVPHDARGLIADGRLDRRLFDVTELSRPESRKAYRDGLRLIVAYGGASGAGAREAVRAAGDTEPERPLRTLNADAVTATPGLWKTLTRGTDSAARATASGISRIWLDGIRKAALEKSTGQIGAPQAWRSGYEGKGVRIAVLDTGVDAEHPDLKGRVVASRNFSASPDAVDRQGHGTHVASTAAGSGARSDGTHRGVAPQAGIISGKVLDDDGYGSDSETVAGIEWAVAQGADIVNLSLGSRDHPGIDPVEAQVDKMTADKGVLFAVAAGNSGGNAIGSPGSADGAFTVGAVDRADKLADFSSTGPRIGGGIKPDVAAPGVDISAAAAAGTETQGGVPGYSTMSGTSMATPHVAGAAALLKQRHPEWKAGQLRSALASSAVDTGHTPYEQGAGRISVDRAMQQTVFAEEVSLDLGKQLWPHTDNAPVTKKLTYRNSGTADITLDLTVTGHAPGNKPAPAGFFTTGADRVTVPAGGSATVDVTADTRIGGGDDGHFTASVIASGEGQTVRSTVAIEREAESYDVTLKHIGPDGRPSTKFETALISRTVPGLGHIVDSADGDVTVRIPKGEYVLNADARDDPADFSKGRDVLVQPRLTVDRARTITLDARTAKPVRPTVPDPKAVFTFGVAEFAWSAPDGGSIGGFYPMFALDTVRIGHLGPQITDGSLNQTWTGSWRGKSGAEYKIATGGPVKRIPTGYTRAFKSAEFAAVKVGLGASAEGKRGALEANALIGDTVWGVSGFGAARPLPDTRTLHVLADGRAKWGFSFGQVVGEHPDGYDADATLDSAPRSYRAGKTYRETFNTAVFGPMLGRNAGSARLGDRLYTRMPFFSDGSGNAGSSDVTSATTTLYRNGTKIAENADALTGREPLAIGRDAGEFRLAASVARSAATARVSTRIDAEWTFRADAAPTDDEVLMPLSTVRFSGAGVGPDSTAPAGATQTVPLRIDGAAAGGNVKALTAHASYDGGRTWRKLTVTENKVTVKNPARGKSIALRAQVTDKQGGGAEVTVYDGFFGK